MRILADMNAAASPKQPRPRKRSGTDGTDEVVELQPEGASRRIFRGVKLPETPIFALESASDPDVTMEFTGIAALPGMPAMRLVVDGISVQTLPVFFRQILGEEQYERFVEFADDPDNGITLDVLTDLAKYLVEMYTGRPTKGSTAS